MNNRVSFASVLKGNHGNHKNFVPRQRPKTLSEYMELYIEYGDHYNGYTINLDHSGTQSRRTNNVDYQSYDEFDYEDGVNPLDAWVSSQVNLSKENINNQSKKKSNHLMKLINSNSQSREGKGFTSKPAPKVQAKKPPKNMNMGELCRMYAQQKDSVQSSLKDPVWKFGSRNSYDSKLQDSQMRVQTQKKPINLHPKYHQSDEECLEKFTQVKEDKMNGILRKIPQTERTKKNLFPLVQQIKDAIVPEIETMAQQIVTNRKKEEDEEMLISQRSEFCEKDRIENARKQIGQYLKIKQQNSRKNDQRVLEESEDEIQDGVGYSFSHEFSQASRRIEQKKRQSLLPNIEEVRSEHDYTQAHQEHQIHENYPQIDAECIQQIQSVAYIDQKPQFEERIKQSLRYENEYTENQAPVINLSLENYVKSVESPQKTQQLQNSGINASQIVMSMRSEVQYCVKQINSQIEVGEIPPKINQSIPNEFAQKDLTQTEHLEIVEVLSKPQFLTSMNNLSEETSLGNNFINSSNEMSSKDTMTEIQPQEIVQVIPDLINETEVQQLPMPVIEPKVQEPKIQEKRIQEPKIQETKIQEPRIQEPKIQQPKVEQSLKQSFQIAPQQSIKITPYQSFKVEEKMVESKREQEHPKRLIKITLSPKYPPPSQTETSLTNSFALNEKLKNSLNKSFQVTKDQMEERKKENDENLLNKMSIKEEKVDIKNSIKIGLKDSVKNREYLVKASSKKSAREEMSLNNSIADDFQFDLDI